MHTQIKSIMSHVNNNTSKVKQQKLTKRYKSFGQEKIKINIDSINIIIYLTKSCSNDVLKIIALTKLLTYWIID